MDFFHNTEIPNTEHRHTTEQVPKRFHLTHISQAMRSALIILYCFAIQVNAFTNGFGAIQIHHTYTISSSHLKPPSTNSFQLPTRSFQQKLQPKLQQKLQQKKDSNAEIGEGTSDARSGITIKQKAEVLLYRITLISASTAYACIQLSNMLLGAGSGLSLEYITSIQQTSHAIVGWGILFAALLAPPYLGAITDTNEKNDANNAFFLLLNELLPNLAGFAIIVEVINTIQANLSQGTAEFLSATSPSLDNTTNIFISFICLREIGFYGASYKAEAILAILFCLALGLNDSIGFSEVALTSGLGLSLLVLSFAKVFEPLEDDLEPNQSAFFKDEPL